MTIREATDAELATVRELIQAYIDELADDGPVAGSGLADVHDGATRRPVRR